VIPALQSSGFNLIATLKESGGKTSDGKKRNRLHGLLVISEVGIAMILLVGAGLLIKSFYKLQQVDLGFNPASVLTMRLSLPEARYAEPQKARAFFDELVSRTEDLPGVKSVGVVSSLPLSGSGVSLNMFVEDKPENQVNVELLMSNPKYLNALGLELQEGRFFNERDRDNTPYVAVVNEAFARSFLPGESVLGKRVKMGALNAPFPWLSIVGVLRDIKHQGPNAEAKPEMFVPYTQAPLGMLMLQSMFLAVRTDSNPERSVATVRGIVREIDPEQPIFEVSTMQELLAATVATHRFNMLLVGIFSMLALLLAAIGIYGVMSYTVAARTREIGIRMALGARTVNVLSLVIRDGMVLALAGLTIGICGALALTRLMSRMLFQVTPTDLTTFAFVSILLIIVALVACILPARRASLVEPMEALRRE